LLTIELYNIPPGKKFLTLWKSKRLNQIIFVWIAIKPTTGGEGIRADDLLYYSLKDFYRGGINHGYEKRWVGKFGLSFVKGILLEAHRGEVQIVVNYNVAIPRHRRLKISQQKTR